MNARGIAAVASLAIAILGCSDSSDSTNPDYCNVKLADVTPATPTLHVGNTVTLTAAYTGACSPNVPTSSLRWSSNAPAVVAVDSVSGTVTALSLGSASVDVHLPGSAPGQGIASALVSVVAP